jgi:hypothetical protein
MKRLALFVLVLAAFGVPSAAHAAVPCRDRIYNDWYADGKIATNYPIACYKSALAHIPQDAKIYSNLSQDIQTAMQAAIAQSHGATVPSQVGDGEKDKGGGQHNVNQSKTVTDTTATTPLGPTTVASGETSSSGSGLPVPIIILGALAILLAAAGAIGAGVRHFRGRGPSV